MIKQILNIVNKWKVIVYYNLDCNLFHVIETDLYNLRLTEKQVNRIKTRLCKSVAKAVTISSSNYKTTIVIFNKHKSKEDYINSIVHESEHIKQDVLSYYNVNDYGEDPAYTIGYIAMKLIMFCFDNKIL